MTCAHLKKMIDQKNYEKIVKVLRRDKIILLAHLSFYLLLFVVPFIVTFFFKPYFGRILADKLWYPVLVLGASTYFISVWTFLFTAVLDYYLDVWVITSDRFLNIEQHMIFARTISELDLYKIQDATSDANGIIATIFNYGAVHIQTAGEAKRFEMKQVPNPHEVRKLIMDLAEEDRKFHKKQINV